MRGLASHFVWTNRSKESLTLDVKHPEAQRILQRLIIEQADVLVQNLAPGAAARLGLGYETLSTLKPELIVCDISGYGNDGPYRDKKAYDLLIQSEAGFLSVTGTEETPSKAGPSIADIAAGMYAYSNILAALLQRNRPAVASTSTSPCSSRWWSGRATRCITRSKAHHRRRAPAPATPRSILTDRFRPATGRP